METTLRQQTFGQHTHRLTFIALVVGSIVVISLLHYMTSMHLLPYHDFYRSLYYIPLALAAVRWGLRGGAAAASVISLLHLPYVLLYGVHHTSVVDGLLEIAIFLFVGLLAGGLADRERHQRRQAQALQGFIDDVLHSLPVGVATIDGSGIVMPQNEVAATLLPPDLSNAMRMGAAMITNEYQVGGRIVNVKVSPLRNAASVAHEQVLVLEDVTEPRRLQAQIRQAERLNALGRLAAGLAHEIRNPLAIVRATAQLLEQQLLGRLEVARHLEVLTTESDRIEHLVGELVAYAQPQHPRRTLIDVNGIVAEVVRGLEAVAEQHRVQLQVIGMPLPLVQGDHEQLRQALVNLVLNAIQASPSGTAVVVSASADGNQVCMRVTDAGPGVAQPLRSIIFDPFFTTREGGMGLGLAHVARIVEDHGGTITVEGEAGQGATFVVCLPQGGTRDA